MFTASVETSATFFHTNQARCSLPPWVLGLALLHISYHGNASWFLAAQLDNKNNAGLWPIFWASITNNIVHCCKLVDRTPTPNGIAHLKIINIHMQSQCHTVWAIQQWLFVSRPIPIGMQQVSINISTFFPNLWCHILTRQKILQSLQHRYTVWVKKIPPRGPDIFYRRDAMLARVIAIAKCPSVRHALVLCQKEES